MTAKGKVAAPEDIFADGGEMGALMRSLDWSQTLFGPVSGWAQSLKTATSIILNSRYPMFIWWGAEYANLYNDAYRPILGTTKHPQFLGKSAKDCWAEIWDVVGLLADSVLSTGQPTWSDRLLLMIDRNGYLEETYFTFSYSPVRDESGGVGGVFCAVIEITQQVISDRRLQTLRELASNAVEAKTVEKACHLATKTLSNNPLCIPFALLYQVEADGKQAWLMGTTGIEAGTFASPQQIDLTQETDGWHLARIRRTGQAEMVDDLATRFGALPKGVWLESPHSALVMPLAQSGHKQQLAGFLVVGISPRRAFDDEYRGFFDLVASNVATAIANADAYEAERKRAEALAELDRAKTAFFSVVRESEERFRVIVNQAAVGIAQSDLTGRYTLVNQRFCDIVGYPSAELLQKRMQDITHPDDLPRNAELFQRMVTQGQNFVIEKRYIRKDGSEVWVSNNVAVAYDASGKPQYAIAVVLDISDRKRSEAQRENLLTCEQRYTNQLGGLTKAALAINSARSVEEVLQVITEQAYVVIGTHQSVTSMTVDLNWAQAINAVYLSDKYAQWRDYDKMPDGSGIYACVCHLNRPMRLTQAELEAHPRWQGFGKQAEKHPPMRGWLAAPLVGRDGRNIGLIQLSDKYEGEFTEEDEAILVQLAQMASVAVENTRLYEAEQQARAEAEAARAEAEAANRTKDEFLAVLSHEIRSPLNPILGWSKLLQSRKFDEKKTAYALETIERNAKTQLQLIEDLLDVSRILQGKLSLNAISVDLASTIKAAMETVRLAAEAKSIEIQAILKPDVGPVLGDPNRLQQVVWNLLSNAVKFTPSGGQVNVRLECIGSQAQIIVSDTGKGIHPDFLPYVFDYFRQADSTTTRKFGGLGLGLAIVRQIVELHGGTVQADSPGEGQGATFTVRLPLMRQPSQMNPDNLADELSSNLFGIKALVVDDEADSREFVTFLLEQAGVNVTAVASASEALTALTQSIPDVLVSDIGMPDIDGYMLLRYIRALPPEQGGLVPAIALTAYASEVNQQQARSAGFQQHLPKPVEPNDLVTAIATLVREFG